jgi:hypothetical protein
VTNTAPLPLAPPPYRAEALHSWLRRVAAPYRMTPEQLLHAVGVGPYTGPSYTRPHVSLQSALGARDIRNLARIARCDPSRLGLAALRTREWILGRNEWEIACPLCIRASLDAGSPVYERALWRLGTCTFCTRHRTPLIHIDDLAPVIEDLDRYAETVLALSDLERIVGAQLFEFEREICRAFRGIAPSHFDGTLTATGFLLVLRDLTDFTVHQWRIDGASGVSSSLDQHSWLQKRNCSSLFRCRSPKRFACDWSNSEMASLAQIPDPSTRRAALWLVMQVIRAPPTRPVPPMRCISGFLYKMLSLVTGRTPAGHGWRPRRKRGQRPTAHGFGRGFRVPMTALKVQMTSMKVRNDRFKGYRQLPKPRG